MFTLTWGCDPQPCGAVELFLGKFLVFLVQDTLQL